MSDGREAFAFLHVPFYTMHHSGSADLEFEARISI